MTNDHVTGQLSDYDDGLMEADAQRAIESHLSVCAACRGELEELRSLRRAASRLPRSLEPAQDLWPGIRSRLSARGTRTVPVRWYLRAAAVVLVAATGAVTFFLATRSDTTGGWRVQRLEGAPRIASGPLATSGELHPGDWLETDSASEATIAVGLIGHVDVGPNTRLRIAATGARDHRLSLAVGTIKASISAPPRIFFVETPSALATDLGCEYRLHVDETGASVLLVTAGWVELSFAGRTSIIPSGAMCATRSGFGPGTPYNEHAGEPFRGALTRYDFENGGRPALDTLLARARDVDAVTLWHLLLRTRGDDRAAVYDRFAALTPPPEGITRGGILAGDPAMLRIWQSHLGLDYKRWWKFWQ